MTQYNRAVGAHGENLAARHLERCGWTILARNWRCAVGEIDIVATDPDGALAVVEVRTRRSPRSGSGAESITAAKLARLRRLSAAWLREHPHPGDVRVDVVSILLPLRGHPEIDHLIGVSS